MTGAVARRVIAVEEHLATEGYWNETENLTAAVTHIMRGDIAWRVIVELDDDPHRRAA